MHTLSPSFLDAKAALDAYKQSRSDLQPGNQEFYVLEIGDRLLRLQNLFDSLVTLNNELLEIHCPEPIFDSEKETLAFPALEEGGLTLALNRAKPDVPITPPTKSTKIMVYSPGTEDELNHAS